MELKNLRGQAVHIPKGVELNEEQLSALKWSAFDGGTFKKNLTSKQKKQFIEYAMSEAEKYSSGHSMRYTIMRDCIKAIM